MIKKMLNAPTMTVAQLASKYSTSEANVRKQLAKGVKVEKEHTNHVDIATEIASDHLGEDLYYYDKLKKIESAR